MAAVKASWKNMARLKDKLRRLPLAIQEEVKPALKDGAQIVASDIERDMRGGAKTGRIYKRRGRVYQSSAAGEAPAVLSGALVGSIKVEDIGGNRPGVRLRVTGAQAFALEFGSTRSAARPFLFPALKRNRPKVNAEIKRQVKASLQRMAARGGRG